MKVFMITRTCYGEDYPDPETNIELFETREKARQRFDEIITEEEEYTDQDVRGEIEEVDELLYVDFVDSYNDYRVVLSMKECEVK